MCVNVIKTRYMQTQGACDTKVRRVSFLKMWNLFGMYNILDFLAVVWEFALVTYKWSLLNTLARLFIIESLFK